MSASTRRSPRSRRPPPHAGEVKRAAVQIALPKSPLELAHQRAGRMAEQFLDGSRIELIQAFELLGVNAARDEQAIDAKTMRAGEVGSHGIADGEHPAERSRLAPPFGRQRHGALVDRTVRLAVENRLAAEFCVEFGDRARAIDQAVAAFDDDVGIGADQRELAFARLEQHRAIVFRRFGFVVEQSGTDNVVGLFERHQRSIEAAMDRAVALGTDPEDLLAGMTGDKIPREVARTDDGIISVVGNIELAQLPLY